MEKEKFKVSQKSWFLLANAILVLGIFVGDVCYITLGGLLAKALTSALFVVLGALNLTYVIISKNKDLKFPILMLVGLVFAMCGDIVLEVEFIVGAALFAIGHIFYFVAYCFLNKLRWLDLVIGAITFVPSVLFITLAPIFDFGGVLMEVVCVVYAVIISCMVGKAISNLIAVHSFQNLIIVLGSILFFFSDLMLLLHIFANLPRVVDILCLVTYYPAQCYLALSIFIHKNKDAN